MSDGPVSWLEHLFVPLFWGTREHAIGLNEEIIAAGNSGKRELTFLSVWIRCDVGLVRFDFSRRLVSEPVHGAHAIHTLLACASMCESDSRKHVVATFRALKFVVHQLSQADVP